MTDLHGATNALEIITQATEDAQVALQPETTTEVAQELCPVCHRPLKARAAGRGRKKEVHKTCSILRSRMAEMEAMLSTMEFGDEDAVRMLRGNMFAMVNQTLRKSVVTINPSNDEDI